MLANAFSISMQMHIGFMNFNLKGPNTPMGYSVVGIMIVLITLAYLLIANFILNRIFQLPGSVFVLCLSNKEAKSMVKGYKLKLFGCMLLAWGIPTWLLFAGHEHLFDMLAGLGHIKWITGITIFLK